MAEDATRHDEWCETELLEGFEILASQPYLPVRFCFLVDGLDEYADGQKRYKGTFVELVEPLKHLAASASIKFCVCSRPWNAFNEYLGNAEYQLQLEDLTRDDIRQYVEHELHSKPRFMERMRNTTQRTHIPEDLEEYFRLLLQSIKDI